MVMGRKYKAVQVMEEAEKIDPLSPIVSQSLGNIYVFVERYDDALRQAEKLLEINPAMRIGIELKAWATGMKGDWEEALLLFKELHRLTNHPLKGLMGMGYTYAKLHRHDKAMECITKLEQREVQEPGSAVDADIAAIWFGLGNLDKTFHYLNRCLDKRLGPVSYFLQYPPYKGIKNDPRYLDLLKRQGFTEEQIQTMVNEALNSAEVSGS
jgi:tetratricopeptide (TPR) repeat protein